MRVSLSGIKPVFIKGEYIKLDALLKFTAVVSTGGEAKKIIQDGIVLVGDEQCRTRGRKIRPGDVVRCADKVLLVKRETV